MAMSGDDYRMFGKASSMGGLGAGLASLLFGGQDNPYDKASPYFDKINQAYNPYINAGQGAMGQLQNQMGMQMNDPGALMAKLAGGYKQSPGFDWQMKQGMNAANNAAAAGGMAGTPQHQQQAATMAEGLANQDYYNYLQNVMGLYGLGNQNASNMMNQGFNATGQQAANFGNQGALAYANQADINKGQQQMWGDIFGGLGQLAMFM